MILIGQYDSPFVRRVGIALTLYEMPFEHRPWSVFGNAAEIQPYNPLIRVPTLVLDDGTALIESHSILDYLDHRMPAEQRLFPQVEPQRHRALRIASLATGLGEKAVSLFYEQRLHQQVSEAWVSRCKSQISATLAILESDRSQRSQAHWFGDRIGHADIAVAAVLRFLSEAHPGLVDMAGHPALQAHASALEALPVFQQICQPFIPPA
jgi:glutathione S-transferase